MLVMAQQGRIAFTPELHAELKGLAGTLTDIELAARYRVSLPTILKYKRLPISHKHGRQGRPKSSTGAQSPAEQGREARNSAA